VRRRPVVLGDDDGRQSYVPLEARDMSVRQSDPYNLGRVSGPLCGLCRHIQSTERSKAIDPK
jgi:hypothetical protein